MNKLPVSLIIFFVFSFSTKVCSQNTFYSFEDQHSIKDVTTTTGVMISRSDDFPALGAYSLQMTMPKQGGAIYLNTFSNTDWSR